MPDLPELTSATFCATLVDEWARAGVTDAVVCPGSRSTPMALALADDERIRVHVQIDERSGGFMALGLGMATGRPAIVLTTSGTAAVELHPAVVEAHQSRVPLIACTADRPPELHDVGAPQTIDQTHQLYSSAIRWYCDPGVPDEASRSSWRSLASRVFLASAGSPPGPVHLNLAFRDPLVGRPGPLPDARPGGVPWRSRPTSSPVLPQGEVERLVAQLAGRRGVILAGAGISEPAPVLALAGLLGWPVLADPRSGCRVPDPVVVAHFDSMLRSLGHALVPDVVLGLGAPAASKVLGRWVAASGAQVVLVDRDGAWADAEHVAAEVLPVEPSSLCEALAKSIQALDLDATSGATASLGSAEAGAWLARWQAAESAAGSALEAVLAGHDEPMEPAVAADVVAAVPDGGALVVSSSMPVRDVEWYSEPRSGVRVLANRGANGIDGVVSTALGVALAGGPVVALVGDLAFLHDANALVGASDRDADLTVVVVDNDGGGIFSSLPQRQLLANDRFEQLFGTPHGSDLGALAQSLRIPATVAATRDEVREHLAGAVASGGAKVVVVPTDRGSNAELRGEIHEAVATFLEPGRLEPGS